MVIQIKQKMIMETNITNNDGYKDKYKCKTGITSEK